MKNNTHILTDSFQRKHTYLRISLTERCNLRCTYCMPAEGIPLIPKSHIMSYDEIYTIAETFVDNGVKKIRLTGGEPLIRKDIHIVLEKLASLQVELAITTNGITIDRHLDTLKKYNIRNINVSLDTLNEDKFKEITRRNQFQKVYQNILLLVENGFNVKINAVLIKDFNENEINDFIELTRELPVSFRFIEFMPFEGNKWNMKKMVSYAEIMMLVNRHYSEENVERLQDADNDTSKNYRIKGFKGSFAIISSVTNPFCDSCNRLRLTADGKLKNCLFSATESDILAPLREGNPIEPIIQKAVLGKFKVRGGMDTLEKLQEPKLHTQNRNMTSIGG